MGKIVIKKRISLDFLGDEYKEAYLVFKSIPISDIKQFVVDTKNETDEVNAIQKLIDVIKDRFISGKFPDDKGAMFDVALENIDEFDNNTISTIFKILTGQDTSPN